jgi:hypothetical protein
MDIVLFFIEFALFGIGIFYLDGLVLRKVFTKSQKGMIIGRHFQAKLVVATVFILIKWILFQTYFHSSVDAHFELLYTVWEWFSVMCGFYLAPWFLKMFPGVWRKTIDYANKVESGAIDPLKDLKARVTEKSVDIAATVVKKEVFKENKTSAENSTEEVGEGNGKALSNSELIENFKNGKKS